MGQWLWGNTSEWKVSVVESKRKVTEKEGHSLEACCRPFLLPEEDHDDITASLTDLSTMSLKTYSLLKKRVLDPPKKCSNAQTSEVTRELFIPFNICLISWKPMCHIQSKDNTRLVPTFIQQSSCNAQCQRSNRMYMRCKTPSIGSADGKITRTGSICGVQIKKKKGLLNFNGNFRA